MKIIFDLDYTLLDTDQLHQELKKIFDREGYQADYQEYFKKQNINFSPDKYLAILRANDRLNRKREKYLKIQLFGLMNRLDIFLKPGVTEVLAKLRQTGNELILMTFGNKEWQAKKVENLKISPYFSRIIFADRDKNKSGYLKELAGQGEDIWVINDNFNEAEEMRNILGARAKIFLIKGKYNNGVNFDLDNLNELLSLSNN